MEIWQEFLQGAETFERCAKATLSPRTKTWRSKQVTTTIASMSRVTKQAWERGLLSSIAQLRNYINQDHSLFSHLISSDYQVANLFLSLTGFTSWTSERNDKTEWDVDEKGETVFFIPPITYFCFEDGLLAKWGLVESSMIYIGEVHGNEDIDFDDNELTPKNRSRVLASYASVCRFLSDVTRSEILKNMPTTISATEIADQHQRFGKDRKTVQNWMSDTTFPLAHKGGRARVFIRHEVAIWLKNKKGVEL